MSNLETKLAHIASDLVEALVAALRSASIDEITGLAGPAAPRAAAKAPAPKGAPARAARSARRHRASAAEVAEQKRLAYDTARTLKGGFSKGEVMKKSRSNVDLGRSLTLLVADGVLKKQGDRRLTRYWVK
jgi:ribosomal protein L12E/L44/L45/RPP1/RPP2